MSPMLLKALPYAAAAIAIAGAAAWLDHRGYARAEQHAKVERLERQRTAAAIVVVLRRDIDAKLAALSAATNSTFQQIDRKDRTIVQPIIEREILRDPGLASRVCLTPELLNAVNIARGRGERQLAPAPDQRPGPARLP